MSIDEMEKMLTEPGPYTAQIRDYALLRIYDGYGFIQYPRSELKLVMSEIKTKIKLVECGVETFSASDRLLFKLLQSFVGDSK